MNINKTQNITLSFKDNGFEVQHYEDNPDYVPQKYNKELGDYDTPYDARIHRQSFIRKFVFAQQSDMLEHLKTLTAL